MKLYKLTDKSGQTYGGCQWGEGVTHVTNGVGEMCDSGWLHAYTHPLLAALLKPLHVNFDDPVLWEAEGDVEKTDKGLKVGTTRLTTIKRIPLPAVTRNQKCRFAVLCAKKVCSDFRWNKWADGWLSGTDRTNATALAEWTAAAEGWAAARAAAAASAAVRAAAAAALAAVRAAAAAAVTAGVWWAEKRAMAAAVAAEQATISRELAGKGELDLISLAEQAVREEPN
jgi:hypothetical protein